MGLEPLSALPFNPVTFVSRQKPVSGIKRALVIAEHAKDAFGIGEAVVDGISFYHYAQAARNIVGSP
jgi:hypothetical protein